jgi:hypothetical protein
LRYEAVVSNDRPDDADEPPDRPPDQPADRPTAPDDGDKPSGKIPPETRYRQEYSDELHAKTAPAGPPEPGARPKGEEPAENAQQAKPGPTWEETAELGRRMWAEYKRRWPPEERPPVDRSGDPPGSWRGDGNRFLSAAINAELEQECDSIADREERTISPRLRDVERCDPDRYLVGFEDRRKGRDRIKEKVAEAIEQYGRSPEEAISLVPDAIRYTFQYKEASYTQGVRDDIARMKEQGFELIEVKNSWLKEQYKGINSRWIDPESSQRVELQFHTSISFEAKQLTHSAYERLRSGEADEFEEMVLEAYQRKLTGEVPIPPGAPDIPDYPERG